MQVRLQIVITTLVAAVVAAGWRGLEGAREAAATAAAKEKAEEAAAAEATEDGPAAEEEAAPEAEAVEEEPAAEEEAEPEAEAAEARLRAFGSRPPLPRCRSRTPPTSWPRGFRSDPPGSATTEAKRVPRLPAAPGPTASCPRWAP